MANDSYIIDAQVNEVAYSEPVTLAEAKLFIRVSHTSEDAQIAELITQARQTIEKATGLSLLAKTVKLWFSNEGGYFRLPYGPVNSSVTFYEDYTGTLLTNTRLVGGNHPVLTFPKLETIRAEYSVGYTSLPKQLKGAILDQVNFMYENRGAGAEGMGICEKVWRVCQQYTIQSPIL